MNWQQILIAVWHGISSNSGASALIGTLLVSAIVRHMPEQAPTSFQALYTWFRSSVQEVVNQRSGVVVIPSEPKLQAPPEAPAPSTKRDGGLTLTDFLGSAKPADTPKAP